MSIKFNSIPYALDSLEPHISKEALQYHHLKHHKGYVDNLKKLIKGTLFEDEKLKDIVVSSRGSIYNNAAQIWNHDFYFNQFSPDGGVKSMTDSMKQYLTDHFDSVDGFIQNFESRCLKFFGSGWVWLIHDNNQAKIISDQNANCPLTFHDTNPTISKNPTVILTWDVWEHNYYIDHRNDRKQALQSFWNVVDWNKISKRVEQI